MNSYTVQKKESLKVYTSEIGAKVENPTLKTGEYLILIRILRLYMFITVINLLSC